MKHLSKAYYNEIDPYAAQWLRNLIAAGHIAPGEVDERSIVDVQPDDLKGYTQCHFFAGIGGWSLASRLAGWPDERPLWTGSCPCQPFSVAGKGEGQKDERHLWPEYFRLIRARAPAVVMGEQVAAAVGKDWLDGVCLDLESIGYTCGAAVVPACAVDAPHRRDRLWFVADSSNYDDGRRDAGQIVGQKFELGGGGESDALADACGGRRSGPGQGQGELARRRAEAVGAGDRSLELTESGRRGETGDVVAAKQSLGDEPIKGGVRRSVVGAGAWGRAEWISGADGKARRIEPSIRLLAHGVPGRVGQLRAYGNAIVPQVAAEVIGAYLDATA